MIVHAEAAGVPAETALGATEPPPSDGAVLRWSRFLAATEAEGPGRRAALWVQGCNVRCPGCFNPHLWAARGALTGDPAELADRWVADAVAAGASGITLLGGEPFDQAAQVAQVAAAFREAGLNVMAFTGYGFEDLCRWAAKRADIADLLAATDLLCDGPYLRARPEKRRPWIGSANQGIRALSPVYAAEVREIAAHGRPDTVEVRVSPDGTVSVNGWASDAALSALLDDLGVRADRPQERVA